MWKKRFKGFLFSVLLVMIVFVISSWGYLAHRTIHQLAIYELPPDVGIYFYNNIDYLQYNSVRPDARRNNDKTEKPKHYIDFEAYGKNAVYTMPLQWSDAIKKFSKDTLLKYGYVPYWIIEMQKRLTNAFRKGNSDSILFYAADLGHYIEDINVPLHTCLNYDGQLTNQKGLHALWETVIPEIEINNYNLYADHKATYIKNKDDAVWNAAQRAHALLPAIFAKETEVSKRFTEAKKYRIQKRNGKNVKYYTPGFAKAYNLALGNMINQQLINSANMVADFWYTAWVDAGKPDLGKLPKAKLNAKKEEQLKKEMISFKQNTLIKDGYLRSKVHK